MIMKINGSASSKFMSSIIQVYNDSGTNMQISYSCKLWFLFQAPEVNLNLLFPFYICLVHRIIKIVVSVTNLMLLNGTKRMRDGQRKGEWENEWNVNGVRMDTIKRPVLLQRCLRFCLVSGPWSGLSESAQLWRMTTCSLRAPVKLNGLHSRAKEPLLWQIVGRSHREGFHAETVKEWKVWGKKMANKDTSEKANTFRDTTNIRGTASF